MSKGKLYTLLVFCLSFAVVFGGWFLTKEMLNRKETMLLARKGQVSMEVLETDFTVQEDFQGEILTEDMMAEILTVWEAGGRERIHEPMAGQMNMEQAIKAGREWIATLAENNILPAYLQESGFDNTNAALYTLKSEVSLKENLISYWKVTYVEDDVKIILMLHAVSGQVWKADISMSEEKMLLGTGIEEEALAIAFPFVTGEDTRMTTENDVLYKLSEKGKVYAALKRDSVLIDKQKPEARLFLGLYTDIEK